MLEAGARLRVDSTHPAAPAAGRCDLGHVVVGGSAGCGKRLMALPTGAAR